MNGVDETRPYRLSAASLESCCSRTMTALMSTPLFLYISFILESMSDLYDEWDVGFDD